MLSHSRKIYPKGNSLAATIPSQVVQDLGLKDKNSLEYVYLGKSRWEIRNPTRTTEEQDDS